MDDSQVHGTIEQLVAEEHELWEREAAGNGTESDRQRLRELKVSLDQCWDLFASAARCATTVATRTRPRSEDPKWSRATSSSPGLIVLQIPHGF